jgi:hypothetical protein
MAPSSYFRMEVFRFPGWMDSSGSLQKTSVQGMIASTMSSRTRKGAFLPEPWVGMAGSFVVDTYGKVTEILDGLGIPNGIESVR